MSIIGATSGELLKRFERGDLQSVDVVTAYLDAIAAQDGKVNAFLHVDREKALAQARAVDEKRRRGVKLGMLGGLPVAARTASGPLAPAECSRISSPPMMRMSLRASKRPMPS
jgi:Asp-tRNA(Asn)/Glu-tRNA(Gln) amidotransferase A subunit family amidase